MSNDKFFENKNRRKLKGTCTNVNHFRVKRFLRYLATAKFDRNFVNQSSTSFRH
jgi:hypothetical protein